MNFKSSTGYVYKFLSYSIKFTHIKVLFENLYKTNNTWDIAEILEINQRTVNSIINDLKLERKSRSSKIHLKMKSEIEDILGYSTITEFYLNGYWIDEYCKELNLCIEIDGEWCHNKDYDNKRDKYIKSLGYNIVRIPAYSDTNTIKFLLKDFMGL